NMAAVGGKNVADSNMATANMAADNMATVGENNNADTNMAATNMAANNIAAPMGGLNIAAESNMAAESKMAAGPRPFPCPLCGRSFATGAGLRRHQRRHGPAPTGTA
ncbi:ZN628 protein, partial [Callaeas wilsoni]|nr:ZN628 protein [Callaeas wilsoni]